MDGFLLYHLPDDHPSVEAVLARRLPTVVVDGPDLQDIPFVGVDDRGGARQAAEHLLTLGHRRIGVLVDRTAADAYQGPVDGHRLARSGFRASHLRLAGYADALAAAGIAWPAVPVQECGIPDRVDGQAGAAALLARVPELTAILATTDLLAQGAIQAAHERGLAVPADLSVVGFDDLPDAASTGLTTVHQPLADKGRIAARLLLQGLESATDRASRVQVVGQGWGCQRGAGRPAAASLHQLREAPSTEAAAGQLWGLPSRLGRQRWKVERSRSSGQAAMGPGSRLKAARAQR